MDDREFVKTLHCLLLAKFVLKLQIYFVSTFGATEPAVTQHCHIIAL